VKTAYTRRLIQNVGDMVNGCCKK